MAKNDPTTQRFQSLVDAERKQNPKSQRTPEQEKYTQQRIRNDQAAQEGDARARLEQQHIYGKLHAQGSQIQPPPNTNPEAVNEQVLGGVAAAGGVEGAMGIASQFLKAGLHKTAAAFMEEAPALMRAQGGMGGAEGAAGGGMARIGGGGMAKELSGGAARTTKAVRGAAPQRALTGGKAAAKPSVRARASATVGKQATKQGAKAAVRKATSSRSTTKPKSLERDVRSNLAKKPTKTEYARAQGRPPGKPTGKGPAPRATSKKNVAKTLERSVERAKKKKASGR